MVSSTAKSHVLNVVRDIRHVESIKKLPGKPLLPQHITSQLKKISTDVIHPDVRYLPGLLLLVVLFVHGVVDSQISCNKCG